MKQVIPLGGVRADMCGSVLTENVDSFTAYYFKVSISFNLQPNLVFSQKLIRFLMLRFVSVTSSGKLSLIIRFKLTDFIYHNSYLETYHTSG